MVEELAVLPDAQLDATPHVCPPHVRALAHPDFQTLSADWSFPSPTFTLFPHTFVADCSLAFLSRILEDFGRGHPTRWRTR